MSANKASGSGKVIVQNHMFLNSSFRAHKARICLERENSNLKYHGKAGLTRLYLPCNLMSMIIFVSRHSPFYPQCYIKARGA